MITAHMLWVFGNLSKIEILCCKSFVKNGYNTILWTYGDITNAPEGVTVKDAREVLPEDKLFLTKGSYANFSDLFRYAVLQKFGGLWADTDVIAIKPADELPKEKFLVVEDTWEGAIRHYLDYTINGNVIYYPEPEYGSVIDLALVYADRFPKDKLVWTEIGPMLLHNIVEIYPGHGFDIKDVTFANSIKAGDVVEKFLAPGEVPEGAHFMHLYNDMWRRLNTDKNALVIPEDSLLGKLFKKYE